MAAVPPPCRVTSAYQAQGVPDRKLRSNFTPGTTPWAMRRAQWSALGLTDEDLEKPKIAIVNSSSQLASCFSHLDEIVAPLKAGHRATRAASRSRCAPPRRPTRSPAPARPGSTSCRRRDLIASDIEVAVEGALLDGMVCLASCDKTTPGQLMAAGRLNIPTIIVGLRLPAVRRVPGRARRLRGHLPVRRARERRADDRRRARARCPAARSPGPASAPAWAPRTPCTWPPRRSAWRCQAPPRCSPSAPRMWDAVAAAGRADRGAGRRRRHAPVDPHARRLSPTPSPRSSRSADPSTASSTCRRSPSRPGATSDVYRLFEDARAEGAAAHRRQAQRRHADHRVRGGGRHARPAAAARAAARPVRARPSPGCTLGEAIAAGAGGRGRDQAAGRRRSPRTRRSW